MTRLVCDCVALPWLICWVFVLYFSFYPSNNLMYTNSCDLLFCRQCIILILRNVTNWISVSQAVYTSSSSLDDKREEENIGIPINIIGKMSADFIVTKMNIDRQTAISGQLFCFFLLCFFSFLSSACLSGKSWDFTPLPPSVSFLIQFWVHAEALSLTFWVLLFGSTCLPPSLVPESLVCGGPQVMLTV